MKTFLTVFLLLGICAYAAEPQKPVAPAETKDDYALFIATAITPENVVDCISAMDQVIDEGEQGLINKEAHPGMLEAATKLGLHIEFSASELKEAIIFYLKISRPGKELKFNDAAKFAALFSDRAGLPHPISLSEGDKSVFFAQWLFRPSDWKKNRKLMVQVRAANRGEKDPIKAFALAINRELDARSNAQIDR
jgi:hypothetical protein